MRFALIGQAVSDEKIFEIVDDGQRRNGRTPEDGPPISSPCKPLAQVSEKYIVT